MTDQVDVAEEVITPQPESSGQAGSEQSFQDRNWAQVREVMKEFKQESARKDQTIEELRQTIQKFMEPKPAPEEDPWAGLGDDDLLEVSKAKQAVAKEAERAARRAMEERTRKERSDPAYLEREARSRHSDFDSVVTPEHIEAIIKSDPLVHQSIMRADDPIEAAYRFISKSAEYHRRQSASKVDMVEKAKLKENQTKPKSPNELSRSQGVTSAVGFGRLSKQQQRELWTEHQRKLGRR